MLNRIAYHFHMLRMVARNLRNLSESQLARCIEYFYAGILTETGGSPMHEKLNYSAENLYNKAVDGSLSGPRKILLQFNDDKSLFIDYVSKKILTRGNEGVADLLYGHYRGNGKVSNDLGNRRGTLDHINYAGKGYIQLTGRSIYEATYNYCLALYRYADVKINNEKLLQYLKYWKGFNIYKDPDLMLRDEVSLFYSILYFINNNALMKAALRGDDDTVRIAMNGGKIGLDRFRSTVKLVRNNNSNDILFASKNIKEDYNSLLG